MHRKKSFVILALVTIALLVYFFSRANSKKKTGNIASVYEDKIDKILIENQQVTITLIKKTAKGDWRLQENNFPVSPTRLASLLQYFNFAEIKSLVARKEENHPKYSVADTNNQTRKEEHGQRVKIFQKDKRVLDLILGRVAYSPERVRFIRFAGENEVYSSSIGSLPDLDLEKDSWLNKRLYNFDAKKIVKFEFTKDGQKDTFFLKEKEFVSQKSPQKKIAEKTLKNYLAKLANLETLPVLKKENLKKDKAAEFANVSLEFADKTIFTIHQFKDKNNFYVSYQFQNSSPRWKLAQEISEKWIFQIPEGTAEIFATTKLKNFYQ